MTYYTEKQVEALKTIYPEGRGIEVYLSTPRKGREFEVQGVGTILKVDRQGIHAEISEVSDSRVGRDFVQILREGHDRFALTQASGVGEALTKQK